MPKKRVSLEEELRYMCASNVAKDFPLPAHRKAIKAVFEWLGLNGLVAWKTENGDYTTNAVGPGGKMRELADVAAVVIDDDKFEAARDFLCGKKKTPQGDGKSPGGAKLKKSRKKV